MLYFSFYRHGLRIPLLASFVEMLFALRVYAIFTIVDPVYYKIKFTLKM